MLRFSKILKQSVVIFAFLFVWNINASTLKVTQYENEIHIMLINESYSLTTVNYNFCLSSPGGLSF